MREHVRLPRDRHHRLLAGRIGRHAPANTGKGHLRARAAAIAEFRRAVDIGTRTKHPVTSASRDKLRQLEKATTHAGKAKP